MSLSPLATVADLEARGVVLADGEESAVATFLDVASAIVRDAAGSPISQTTSTVALEGGPAQWLHLPGQPIQSVDAVGIDGWVYLDWKLVRGSLWRACGWQPGCGPAEVTVTYTHGLAAVPADIVDLVCRLAGRSLVALREDDSATGGIADRTPLQERIGDYSATYSYVESFSEVELPAYLRARLAARFGSGVGLVRSR